MLQSIVLQMDPQARMAFGHCELCCSCLCGHALVLVMLHDHVPINGIADFSSLVKRLTWVPSVLI